MSPPKRRALTVRIPAKLDGQFRRYRHWREQTALVELSDQKVAIELLEKALKYWERSLKVAVPGPRT